MAWTLETLNYVVDAGTGPRASCEDTCAVLFGKCVGREKRNFARDRLWWCGPL